MDPNPKNFPILSYVMAKLPSMKRPNTNTDTDIEQPPLTHPKSVSKSEPFFELTERMPHLTDPHLLASMRSAVGDVSQTRSLLKTLGDRPNHEAVDLAKSRLAEIESMQSNQRDEIALSEKIDPEEEKRKKAIDREKQMHKALISLDQMHESYDKLLSDAEKRLEKIYESAKVAGKRSGSSGSGQSSTSVENDVTDEVVAILTDAMSNGAEKIDLSERRLPFLPEAFGKIRTLVYLNLSCNQLEVIPDSVAGLENLEELNVSSNFLEELPDSIGCLLKLKILDVSSNKLASLPDSIAQCRSLVELDASFNKLTYLPTKMGYELVKLKKLSIPLNKVRNFPTSIGEMKSLQYLDAHFNELRGLPQSIGKLSNLEVLNLGSNFSDLRELPDTIGDLTSLRELDVSNNQIQELPLTFGRLEKLTKLNIDQNPLVVPPKEVVEEGIGAVKVFMAQRWFDVLVEDQEKARREQEALAQASWLARNTSWVTGAVVGAAATVSVFLGGESDEPYLEEER